MKDKPKIQKFWQLILGIGIVAELLLIGEILWAIFSGGFQVEFWQILLFLGITVWIYIAYLKQRTVETAQVVITEKIKTQGLIEQLPIGVCLTDSQGQILVLNRPAARIIGMDEITAISRPIGPSLDRRTENALARSESGSWVVQAATGPVTLSLSLLRDEKGERIGNLLLMTPQEKEKEEASPVVPSNGKTSVAEAIDQLLLYFLASSSPTELTVTLTGSGIILPPDRIVTLFEEEKGLSTAKQIIEKLGGTVWAESAPSKGTRFTMILPKTE